MRRGWAGAASPGGPAPRPGAPAGEGGAPARSGRRPPRGRPSERRRREGLGRRLLLGLAGGAELEEIAATRLVLRARRVEAREVDPGHRRQGPLGAGPAQGGRGGAGGPPTPGGGPRPRRAE